MGSGVEWSEVCVVTGEGPREAALEAVQPACGLVARLVARAPLRHEPRPASLEPELHGVALLRVAPRDARARLLVNVC